MVIHTKDFPDALVEKFLRKWWDIKNLEDIHSDLNIDEYVGRCFKGYISDIDIADNRIFLKIFTLFSDEYDELSAFLRENGLTMQIGNPKDYYEIYLSIKKKTEEE